MNVILTTEESKKKLLKYFRIYFHKLKRKTLGERLKKKEH